MNALVPYLPLPTPQEFIHSEYQKAVNRMLQRSFSPEKSLRIFQKVRILCIEVGHTRFKAAILKSVISLKHLKVVKTIAGESAPWLKTNLHQLFRIGGPLTSLLQKSPSIISLSLFGPIIDRSKHAYWEKSGLPEAFKEAIEKETSRPVMVDGDAVSWAIGALEYIKLHSESLTFPCLAVTLGTGVGLALIENPTCVKAIEIWAMNPLYPKLRKFLTTQKLDSPRQLLEKRFLDNISGGENRIDQKMNSYQSHYNQHFQAFIDDTCEHIERSLCLSTPIASILVGGGYSRFINTQGKRNTLVFSPQNLIAENVSPDIVQLLGCHRNCQLPLISTSTYPLPSEMHRLRKGDPLIDLYNHQEVIKRLFDLEEELEFKREKEGSINSSIYVFKGSNETPFAVFKSVHDPAATKKSLEALQEMKRNGFHLVPEMIKNTAGKMITKVGRSSFICFEYLKPDENSDQFTFGHMLRLISYFHGFSKDITIFSRLHKSKLESYRQRFSYFSDPILREWEPKVFKTPLWEKMMKLANFFASDHFMNIYKVLPTHLIHGENAATSIIFSQGLPFFKDFDALRTDIRLLDLAVIIGENYLDHYLLLLKNNLLHECLKEGYGEFNEMEMEHFHSIIVFSKFEHLSWILENINEALSQQNPESLKKFRTLLFQIGKEIHQILNCLSSLSKRIHA